MWDWRRQTKLCVLTGHTAPVVAVEMSVDGVSMASGDRQGFIYIWDTDTHVPKQVCARASVGQIAYSCGLINTGALCSGVICSASCSLLAFPRAPTL